MRDHLSLVSVRESTHRVLPKETPNHQPSNEDRAISAFECSGSSPSPTLTLQKSPKRIGGGDTSTLIPWLRDISMLPTGTESLYQGFELQGSSGIQTYHNVYSSAISRRLDAIYTDIYFKDVQCSWPFLQERQWRSWSSQQDDGLVSRRNSWQGFFIDMVRSVGALVAQKFDRSSEHRDRSEVSYAGKSLQRCLWLRSSQFYYDRAQKCLPLMLGRPSRISQTQSSLLLTMHAIHSESPDVIDAQASKSMMQCAIAGLNQNSPVIDQTQGQSYESEDRFMERQVLRVCYGLDRLIATAFDRPVSIPDEMINTEVWYDSTFAA